MSNLDDIDENDPAVAAGNEVNEVLLAHKGFWENEDGQAMVDEVQDMCAEAFVRGVRWAQQGNDVAPPNTTEEETDGDSN